MATAQTEAQQAFTARMQAKHITPLWTIANRLVRNEPTPMIPSVFWNYQRDVRPYILEAADIITAAEAHRRVLVLNNPALKHGATHTLTCAIQAIKGGEIAPAHRHSQAALRFIIEGEGAYTAVNGERIYMHPGDFIVTPAWTWHDHGKESDGVMIWLDGLDVPLVNHLGATFSDDYEGDGAFPQSRPPHNSLSRYGSGMLPLEPVTAPPFAGVLLSLRAHPHGAGEHAQGQRLGRLPRPEAEVRQSGDRRLGDADHRHLRAVAAQGLQDRASTARPRRRW